MFVKSQGEQLLNKILFLHSPSCRQDGHHPFLKLVCAFSPDCFDRLSSNFVQSSILLMGGSQLILGKIDLIIRQAEAILYNTTLLM